MTFFLLIFLILNTFDSMILASEQSISSRDRLILNIIKRHDGEIDPSNGLPWGTHNAAKGYHSNFARGTRVHPTRAAMERALFLLASPYSEHHVEGNNALDKVLDLQDRDPQSKTFGVWSWYVEEPLNRMATVDYNWADFQGAVLIIILHDFSHRLQPEILAKSQKSLEYCCRAIMKRDVGPAYTNIAITGATVTSAAGEILRNDNFLTFGRRKILRCLNHFRENGSFGEYNSPAYLPVVIEELERMLYLVADMDCRKAAKELLENVWKMIALRYHVPTGELAGPHSRSYADRLPTKTRNMILARIAYADGENKFVQSAVEASTIVPMRPIDDSIKKYFTIPPEKPREIKSLFIKGRVAFDVVGVTWMDSKTAIGTASYHTFWEQARGLIAYWTIDKDSENKDVNSADNSDNSDKSNDVEKSNDADKSDDVEKSNESDNLSSDNNVVRNNYRNVNLPAMKISNDMVAVFRLRFKHDGNDFASAWGRHYQSGNKIVTAIGLLSDQGSMHPSMDRPVDGIFRAKRFEIVYQLDGLGSSARQIDSTRYELSAGGVRVIIHTTPESQFDGKPISWNIESNLTSARLTGICYSGEEREFIFSKLKNTRIALGLELLPDNKTQCLNTPIKFVETNFKTNREGNFYAIIWQTVNDKSPLLAPINPIKK
ncbi:MAG: hypothetical protein LBB88_03340 [Planctomycetaceae bacterium]|jgi:hypothetical protein|nr:hypothetical protein [Planctomycetaceae bacterium]